MKLALPRLQMQSTFIDFQGGLDQTTPEHLIPPGFMSSAQNYEEDINGGYKTIAGYERFSGQPAPSAALFAALLYSVQGTISVGSVITGATSGATGVVLAINGGYFIITKYTGIFVTENLTTGGASVIGPYLVSGGFGPQYTAVATALAANNYRADIAAVPGAGSILGVWYYKSVVYAFRNTATTGVGMFKSTAGGWVQIVLGFEVSFNTASATAPLEGATITKGATSAVLKRLVIESGTFAAGTAAGRLIFATVTAGPFTAGAFTGGITATAVSQTTITLANQNGRFSFINANFGGQLASLRMYGVDTVNRAFEFDGTTFVPISTGTTTVADAPTHLVEHQNYLFLAIQSSVLISALGSPYNFTVSAGAAEIALSDSITGFMSQPGSDTTATLAVYCRNKDYLLYGTSAVNWQVIKYSNDAGAVPYSVQKIGQTFVLDDRGVTNLSTTQRFGNFAEATISHRVKQWLTDRRLRLSDSHVARDKQQYRLFFTDGSAAYWTLSEKTQSMTPILLPNPLTCSVSDETYGGGAEVIYFGSANGFVYQMERGTSFDGAVIEAFFNLVFNFSGSYRGLKKYRRMTFEIAGSGYSEINSTYALSYGLSSSVQPDIINNVIPLSGEAWDSGYLWDLGVWDGKALSSLSIPITGNGENIAITLSSVADYFSPVKLSGVFLEFSNLRILR